MCVSLISDHNISKLKEHVDCCLSNLPWVSIHFQAINSHLLYDLYLLVGTWIGTHLKRALFFTSNFDEIRALILPQTTTVPAQSLVQSIFGKCARIVEIPR